MLYRITWLTREQVNRSILNNMVILNISKTSLEAKTEQVHEIEKLNLQPQRANVSCSKPFRTWHFHFCMTLKILKLSSRPKTTKLVTKSVFSSWLRKYIVFSRGVTTKLFIFGQISRGFRASRSKRISIPDPEQSPSCGELRTRAIKLVFVVNLTPFIW